MAEKSDLRTWKCLDHDPPYTWQQVAPSEAKPDVCPLQSPEELLHGIRHRIVEVK